MKEEGRERVAENLYKLKKKRYMELRKERERVRNWFDFRYGSCCEMRCYQT